ncbi:MAG: hypothetical protein H6Q74_2761 [Firmicutes bacterium]|nr:hypothetical protein [Bacillota bacterium]
MNNNLPAEFKVALTELAKGIKIKYATDRFDSYQKIVNCADEKARTSISNYLNSLAENDNFINLSMAKDISPLHNPYFLGQEFNIGDTYVMQVSLPNPLNPSHPYTGLVKMTASSTGDFKQMLIEQELDKEKSAEILQNTMQNIFISLPGHPPGDGFKITNLEIKDTYQYSFAKSSSWVEHAY